MLIWHLNVMQKCLTCSRFFQLIWKRNLQSSYMKMQSIFIASCRTVMTIFTLGILRSSSQTSLLPVTSSRKKETIQLTFSSSWMVWSTTQLPTDISREAKCWTMVKLWHLLRSKMISGRRQKSASWSTTSIPSAWFSISSRTWRRTFNYIMKKRVGTMKTPSL